MMRKIPTGTALCAGRLLQPALARGAWCRLALVVALVALLAASACSLVATLGACSSSSPRGASELMITEPPYVSPYNWEGLSQDGGRFVYSEDGTPLSRTGIDVSSHQGSIDWQAVAADGIDFAFIRLGYRGHTEGLLNLDEYFEANMAGAEGAGIPRGVYFFSQALNEEEARAEAQFVLDHLAGRSLEYPIVYDFEPVSGAEAGGGRANNVDGHRRTGNALAFCQAIEAAGYPTMVYGNAQDVGAYYLEVLEGRPIWFAEYGVPTPGGQFDFAIWQYSSTGTVAGIATQVDLNIEFIPAASEQGQAGQGQAGQG